MILDSILDCILVEDYFREVYLAVDIHSNAAAVALKPMPMI